MNLLKRIIRKVRGRRRRRFPQTINSVPVIYTAKRNAIIPPSGAVVVVQATEYVARDEFGSKLGRASGFDIFALLNGTIIAAYDLRTTRYLSGRVRWNAEKRLSAKIHRAAKCLSK
jgi:hypothetical protein